MEEIIVEDDEGNIWFSADQDDTVQKEISNDKKMSSESQNKDISSTTPSSEIITPTETKEPLVGVDPNATPWG